MRLVTTHMQILDGRCEGQETESAADLDKTRVQRQSRWAGNKNVAGRGGAHGPQGP